MTSQSRRVPVILLAVMVGASVAALGQATSSPVEAQTGSVVPPTVKHASVNGADLVYLEQGQGAPVVFVHGAFSDHRAWEGQRERSLSVTGTSR